jgi:hypothetical protein
MYIIEVATRSGKVCEAYETYEEALHQVNQFPEDSLTGMPFIFRELPDGSQRLIRLDGKPLQWHRLPEDLPPGRDEPLPLADAVPAAGEAATAEEDEPLPLLDLPPELANREGPSIKVIWTKAEAEEEKQREAESAKCDWMNPSIAVAIFERLLAGEPGFQHTHFLKASRHFFDNDLPYDEIEVIEAEFAREFRVVAATVESAWGPPEFIGHREESKFPEFYTVEELCYWTKSDRLAMIWWEHQDREVPVLLALAVVTEEQVLAH